MAKGKKECTHTKKKRQKKSAILILVHNRPEKDVYSSDINIIVQILNSCDYF